MELLKQMGLNCTWNKKKLNGNMWKELEVKLEEIIL